MTGTILDLNTKKPINANISVSYINNSYTQEQEEIDLNNSSIYTLDLLPQECKITIRSNNHIQQITNFNLSDLKTNFIYSDFLLLEEVTPQLNQLFLQSSTKSGLKVNNIPFEVDNKTTHLFEAIDANTNENVPANFKLFFTQTKKALEINTTAEKPNFNFAFQQKDIIAVEITSNGFQKYYGNILVDTLDEKTHKNTAKLLKNVSNFNLVFDNYNSEYLLFLTDLSTETKNQLELIQKSENLFYSNLIFEHKYQLNIINSSNSKIVKEFTANEGINQIFIETKKIISKTTPYLFTLYFEQSTTKLLNESEKKLNEIIEILSEKNELKIEVFGHTENIGDNNKNQILSEDRASSIAKILVEKGISENRINAKGLGGNKPIIDKNSKENNGQNRRVEIRIFQ